MTNLISRSDASHRKPRQQWHSSINVPFLSHVIKLVGGSVRSIKRCTADHATRPCRLRPDGGFHGSCLISRWRARRRRDEMQGIDGQRCCCCPGRHGSDPAHRQVRWPMFSAMCESSRPTGSARSTVDSGRNGYAGRRRATRHVGPSSRNSRLSRLGTFALFRIGACPVTPAHAGPVLLMAHSLARTGIVANRDDMRVDGRARSGAAGFAGKTVLVPGEGCGQARALAAGRLVGSVHRIAAEPRRGPAAPADHMTMTRVPTLTRE